MDLGSDSGEKKARQSLLQRGARKKQGGLEMQGAQGRGGGRQSYNLGPEYGMTNNYGAVAYGGLPDYAYNNYVPYGNYQLQSFMPVPPLVPRPSGRGSAPGAFVPLGVQGAGILKRPAGPPQGQMVHGRSGRNRGNNGRSWGSRDRDRARKNLTKEALDADLDEYRMKDKKVGGQSLDAELDEYWKKKGESETQPVDESKELGEGSESGEEGIIDGKVTTGETSLRNKDADKQSVDGTKFKGQLRDS